MTVIKRPQQNYNYPNSAAGSDTESLHLPSAPPSDTESLNQEPISPLRRPFNPPAKSYHTEENGTLKKSSGRKKIRRYENCRVLQTLSEEDESIPPVIMEHYKSPFTRLLEDELALSYWNDFIGKSEDEQTKVLDAFSERNKTTSLIKSSDDKPFGRISSKIKHSIKVKKNLSLTHVKSCEGELLEFFTTTPTEVYIKHPSTSFDRLLLHAIAQYHGLKSISVLNEDGHRSVTIQNSYEKWVPAKCFLTDFIAQLKQ